MAVLTTVLISPAAKASIQRPTPRPATFTKHMPIVAIHSDLTKRLDLSARQKQQLANHRKDIALRLNAALIGDKPDAAAMKKIWELDRKGMRTILTPVQWAKFQKMGGLSHAFPIKSSD